jgi:hypothetical protein
VKFVWFLLSVLSAQAVHSQTANGNRSVFDLKPRWSFGTSANDRFDPRGGDQPESIFFYVNPGAIAGGRLVIAGPPVEAVWINGRLASDSGGWSGSLDSLYSTGEATIHIGVLFEPGEQDRVQTFVFQSVPSETQELRRDSSLRNFVFTALFILGILSAVLSLLQPKLAGDYAGFYKAFALRESEDRLQRSRMGGSGNLPFYLFTSLVVSLLLLLAFQYSPTSFAAAGGLHVSGAGQGLLAWAVLFTGVLIFVAGKLALISLMGILFDVWEFSVAQFFSFIQVLLGASGVGLVTMSLYFTVRGANPSVYAGCILCVWIVLGVWVVTLFMRLIGQGLGRPFYLFSYLCATEIIPLLITLGVVYTD